MKFKFYNYSTLLYFTFFCLYFLPFPLSGSFAGNTDVIVHVSLFKEYIFHIKEFFGMGVYGNSFYPAAGAYMFLENMYGQASIFIVCKLLFLPDYLASYVIIVVLCALNAVAVNKLIFQFTQNKRAALVFGLFFAASCYMLSNLEFLNGISFFPVVFSFYFLCQYFENQSKRSFYVTILFLGIQSFFSGYYFLLGGLFLGFYFLVRFAKERPELSVVQVVFSIFILFAFTLPTFIKLINPELLSAYNPAKAGVFSLEKFAIKWSSFTESFQRNIVYGSFQHGDFKSFRANNGFLIYFFFIVGIIASIKYKSFFLLAGVTALIIAMGIFDWSIFGLTIPSPFKLLFDWNILGNYFRLPYRFFTITLLCLTIIASFGYNRIESKIKYKNLFALIIMIVFTAENIEYKVYTNEQKFIEHIPEVYDIVRTSKGQDLNRIANFPSSLFTNSKIELTDNEFRRDYIYMYWQTYHHQHILNGSASYFPESRMQNNELMGSIDQKDNLSQLILNNQLDYIIFHKNLVYNPSELNIMKYFKNSSLLISEKEDSSAVIFRTVAK